MKETMDLYLEEINKIPLLTIEQEKELGRKIKNGDTSAINKMVEHNLRLVIPVAKHYLNRGFSFEDLIQYGNLGLMTAAEKYDIDKGTKFSTYAVPWIRNGITRALEDSSRNVRIPNWLYREIAKYNIEKQKLEKIKGHSLSLEELSKDLNIPIDKIKQYELLSYDTISLNTEIYVENSKVENILENIINDDYNLEDDVIGKLRDEEILKVITKIIDNPRNVSIILDKYNLMCSNQTLADKYNVSKTTIGETINKSITKLQNSKKILKLIDYSLNEREVKENLIQKNVINTKIFTKKL